MKTNTPFLKRVPFLVTLIGMFDTKTRETTLPDPSSMKTDWLKISPFIVIHLMCLAVFWVGWSWAAVTFALLFYGLRAFALTAFYHRYFSHRTFKTSRWFQFLFGFIGAAAIQRGPLWWASHHRDHHAHSDQKGDVHSPVQYGFWWSHMGWFTVPANFATKIKLIQDFAKFPELRMLDRFDVFIFLIVASSTYGLGAALNAYAPELGTNGMQMLIWGCFISTVALYHVTYMINSLAHVKGSRRYETKDDSRNNFILALLAFGEGWHNNHHYYPNSARQGFFWWEIDMSYYILVVLSWFGLVWDLKPVPESIRHPKPKDMADAAAS